MEKFTFTLSGASAACLFLESTDRFKDFWYHPSSHDIINYANKVWAENLDRP